MKLNRLKTFIFFSLASLPMKGQLRCIFYKLGGVDMLDNQAYIGRGVIFDTICPQNIHISKYAHITVGVTILTHYLITDNTGIKWRYGHVYIGERTFIGANSIICKDVRIGNNCIIGAGSVVTKDIPDNEIWAGNPAKFIKKRIINN